MKIREIEAKTLLSSVPQPDTWFGLKYNMNLYRGCQHHCIYCDSRSLCYGIEDFDGEILVKSNAPQLLEKELTHKRVKGVIGSGSMNDPYMPLEADWRLMAQSLEIIAHHGFGVHILTKSALVQRDLPLLQSVGRVFAAVSFTITTADDDLGCRLEPGASAVSQRLAAMRNLAQGGVLTGVTMMPILPFLLDSDENIRSIVRLSAGHGARYILPCFGMTLRDRQKAHYYARLDALFPGLRRRYEQSFGNSYQAGSPHSQRLALVFSEECERLGIATHLPQQTQAELPRQLELF